MECANGQSITVTKEGRERSAVTFIRKVRGVVLNYATNNPGSTQRYIYPSIVAK